MEETLGKRIVRCRKGLGLTQDVLAERLGVTAQAVSKWENDQSCPDITMLPKLAEVFGITIDMLLGVEPPKSPDTPSGPPEPETHRDILTDDEKKGLWEVQWNSGRKSAVGFAVWLLIAGLSGIQAVGRGISLWGVLWASGLLTFGLFGLHPKFSLFRLGCAIVGWFFLLDDYVALHIPDGILFPVFLLLFGLGLLADALRKPKKAQFQVFHNGKHVGGRFVSECTTDGEYLDCSTVFCEDCRKIVLPRLSGGDMHVVFGSLTVDLSGCGEIAPGCTLDASSTFGKMTILVPRRYRVEPDSGTAFGTVEIVGSPSPDARETIRLTCSAVFGHLLVRYI